MSRYLISFDDGWMDFPESELPAAAEDAHRVLREAKAAGVWITGGGLQSQQARVVDTDGRVTPGPFPETKAVLGGFVILELSSMDEAEKWAAKFAKACRCKQEIRVMMDDPEV